ARTDEARVFKALGLGFVGLFFWSFIFVIIWRMLLYFRNTQGIGDLLAGKLLGLALLTFLGILLLSNIITSLSTFFLSQDLELLMASPADRVRVYLARLTETIANSSWMVVLLTVPLFLAYGFTYRADPGFYLLAAGVMVPYLVLPAVVGTAITLILVNVFPARRARDLLALIGIFTVAGVVVLFRFLRPERLVRPDEFRDLVDFMAVLRAPSSVWLPNEWATDALMAYLNGFFDPFPFLLLLSTAAAFVVVLISARVVGGFKILPADQAEAPQGFKKVLFRKYYVDEIYDGIVVQPLIRASRFSWKVIDQGIVDGIANGLGHTARALGWIGSLFQTGSINTYALFL
ncbi:MAG: hypothetical protein KAJ42_00800, partial [Gemmatimonadetes bacterium]|nr:hypothetical protein [Gemmatimonadota bacterium]